MGEQGNHVFATKKLKAGSFKFGDTQKTRDFLSQQVAVEKNYIGTNEHGQQWYSYISKKGNQIYAYTKYGIIKGARYNDKDNIRDLIIDKGLTK